MISKSENNVYSSYSADVLLNLKAFLTFGNKVDDNVTMWHEI